MFVKSQFLETKSTGSEKTSVIVRKFWWNQCVIQQEGVLLFICKWKKNMLIWTQCALCSLISWGLYLISNLCSSPSGLCGWASTTTVVDQSQENNLPNVFRRNFTVVRLRILEKFTWSESFGHVIHDSVESQPKLLL